MVRDWQTLRSGRLNLHWYEGDQAFANETAQSAVKIARPAWCGNRRRSDRDVELYIYASTDQMREAVLYEPGWTGGLAYPDYNLTIIDDPPRISPGQADGRP